MYASPKVIQTNQKNNGNGMSDVSSGRVAEETAVQYLKNLGYKILATNWRTRYCEIDIVALKQACVFFVEVKYRKQNSQGSGFDYITTKKMQQMRFAAEMWVSQNEWSGDYSLAAIEVNGLQFIVSGFEVGFI